MRRFNISTELRLLDCEYETAAGMPFTLISGDEQSSNKVFTHSFFPAPLEAFHHGLNQALLRLNTATALTSCCA